MVLSGRHRFCVSGPTEPDTELEHIPHVTPARFRVDAERLDRFLDLCPSQIRWAVEFRDPSWLCDEVYDVLRAHKAALVVHDLVKGHPEVLTTDWTYRRFHGPGEQKYHGSYSDAMLRLAARTICTHLRDGRDVYAYFNNDSECHAVYNGLELKRLVAGEDPSKE